jgi:tetratricopeptide (TPR) repeat protein
MDTDPSALATRAEKAYRSGKYAESAGLFQQAAEGFTLGRNALKAAEMSNNRSVALLQAGDAQGALAAAQGTETVFAGAGDTYRQALALGNQAAALDALNQPGEALERYWQCSDLLKSIGEKEYRASVLKSISALQIRTGKQFEALASMDAALDNQKRLTLQERFLKKLLDIPMRMLGGGRRK